MSRVTQYGRTIRPSTGKARIGMYPTLLRAFSTFKGSRHLLLLLLLGCGGGDSVGPSNPYPNVAGIYAVTGRFDGLTEQQARFSGTLTITQGSQQVGTLGGEGQITASINGQTLGGTLPLQQASVSTTGAVTFMVVDNSATWTFTGQSAGSSIGSGRHTITDGTTTLSGSWEGAKH